MSQVVVIRSIPKIKGRDGAEFALDMIEYPFEYETVRIEGDRVHLRLSQRIQFVTTRFDSDPSGKGHTNERISQR